MNRSYVAIAFFFVEVLTMASANTLAVNASDETNIRAVATAYAEAWNHHDMKTGETRSVRHRRGRSV
jgi:hypothetical protein